MEEATEYLLLEVCEIDAARKMTQRVNKMMKEGWRPLGGPSITQHEAHYVVVYQAMVRGGDIEIPGS
jgi:hypothetical protein